MEVVYCEEIEAFIKKLQKPTQSKVVRSIELIETYGQSLGMPHVKKITSTLSELRIRGQQEVRIFFCIQKKKAIFLHGFIKKTQKTPREEIKTAENRFQSVLDTLTKT